MANLYAYCFVYDKKDKDKGGMMVELGHFNAVSDAEAKGKASILFEDTHPDDHLRSVLTHKCAENVSDAAEKKADNGYPKHEFTF